MNNLYWKTWKNNSHNDLTEGEVQENALLSEPDKDLLTDDAGNSTLTAMMSTISTLEHYRPLKKQRLESATPEKTMHPRNRNRKTWLITINEHRDFRTDEASVEASSACNCDTYRPKHLRTKGQSPERNRSELYSRDFD